MLLVKNSWGGGHISSFEGGGGFIGMGGPSTWGGGGGLRNTYKIPFTHAASISFIAASQAIWDMSCNQNNGSFN